MKRAPDGLAFSFLETICNCQSSLATDNRKDDNKMASLHGKFGTADSLP